MRATPTLEPSQVSRVVKSDQVKSNNIKSSSLKPSTAELQAGKQISKAPVKDSVPKDSVVKNSARLESVKPRPGRADSISPLTLGGVGLDEAQFTVGGAGDHASVQQFLTVVYQSPANDAFVSTLEDPFYEPSDRLLMKRGSQIVSHLLLSRRALQLGGLMLPILNLSWLGTLPEYRGLGYASRLLTAANERMAEDGAMLALTRTRLPHFFREHGFALCGRHSFARAGAHELLAQLNQLEPNPLLKPALYIRPWRQVELPGLMRLYAQGSADSAGMYERTEAYWRWLLGRNDFDHIFVAVRGRPRLDSDDDGESIVGYVIVRQEQVLELMVLPDYPEAGRQLLSRACHEAIERDLRSVILHSRPDDPLLQLFELAGGTRCHSEAEQGEVLMARLSDPVGFLQALCPELHRRATGGSIDRPFELGLCVDGEKFCLVVSRRSVKVSSSRLGRSKLTMSQAEFTRLIMGHLDVAEAVERGRIESSTRAAVEMGKMLFPQLPLWRPPLDHLLD